MRTPLNHVMIMADLMEHELEAAGSHDTDDDDDSW